MREIKLKAASGESSIFVGASIHDFSKLYANEQLFVITDENVAEKQPHRLEGVHVIVLPPGEKAKTLHCVAQVYETLFKRDAQRGSRVIAFGGGAITDLAGYVAATYLRGLHFSSFPTTVLAQVDASVGGKNGVNFNGAKNLIGVTRQAEECYCDLEVLGTLPKSEYIAGFAEVIKAAAIYDAEFFNLLEEQAVAILARDFETLERVISRAIEIKRDFVEKDELEKGDRKKLNFGHTIGHPIEVLNSLSHGDAIAVGMQIAAALSVDLGYLRREDQIRLHALTKRFGLPTSSPLVIDEILSLAAHDKKRVGEDVVMVLLTGIGTSTLKPVKLERIESFLRSYQEVQ